MDMRLYVSNIAYIATASRKIVPDLRELNKRMTHARQKKISLEVS